MIVDRHVHVCADTPGHGCVSPRLCESRTFRFMLPTRSYDYRTILEDPIVHGKLMHGSDWPIISVPPATLLEWRKALQLMRDRN